jgi:hypothetical protein
MAVIVCNVIYGHLRLVSLYICQLMLRVLLLVMDGVYGKVMSSGTSIAAVLTSVQLPAGFYSSEAIHATRFISVNCQLI